jgi:hypothetical protein
VIGPPKIFDSIMEGCVLVVGAFFLVSLTALVFAFLVFAVKAILFVMGFK